MTRRNNPLWTLLFALLIAGCGGGGAGGGGGSSAPPVAQASVPSVTGLAESAAITVIRSAGFFAALTGK